MNETENRDQSSSNYEIDIIKYASVRKQEIDLLRNDAFLTKEDKNKSLFQLLPRHMRRRTMGYLRKRLPHRIRKLAIIKPPSKVNKRPSRKHRRRPANLLKEYDRRKRDGKVWLETHIWHAKRFHMSESLYGYRLALHDNCKSKRAAYKCLSKYACIHDESYYVCLQLEGRQEDLLQGLAKLSSSKTGLTFAAKLYLNGQFEGRTVMYEENKYPFGCIGPVRFLWKAVDDHLDDNFNRYLWIWSHPSVYKRVETQLINVFELESQTIDEFDANSNAKKRKLNEEKEKQTCDETTRSNQNPVYHSSSKHIKLKNLKDKLVRFKLLGPLSTSILANALKTFQPNECSETE
jgi:ribonuclease P/MRP protein subunit POP1